MPHEVVGEILVGLVEAGAEIGTSGDKKGKGCIIGFVLILIAVIIGLRYYYVSENPTPLQKGVITKKLPNDKVIVNIKGSEDVYTINHELYVNKRVNDSIILNN